MKAKTSLSIIIPVILVAFILISGCAPSDTEIQLKTVTGQIQKAVQSEMDGLDSDLSAAAASLSKSGLSGPEARGILNGVYQKHPYIIDTCTTDAVGIMVTVAPDAYSRYEGTDISHQDVTIEFTKTGKPILSQVFRAVEDVNAVVIMWPIPSTENSAPSSVSVLFKPETLLDSVIRPVIKDTNISVNVMQLDGLNIYDSEGGETGKNLFTDPVFQPYKDLISLGKRMVAQESGSGSYTYVSQKTGQTTKKLAYWQSAGLHGNEWRIMSMIEAAR